MQRKSFLFASVGAFIAGCGRRERSAAHFQNIEANGEPLKSAFNSDADKVRILMLVSPT
jgi:hypothetical protein